MKLSDGKKGKNYVISHIELPLAASRRLQMLGMTAGSGIYVLNRKKGGPMIVKVRGTRFALGRGFCEGIYTEEAAL